jgi:hypothetical protein
MKKIILLLIFTSLLHSCSSDSNNDNPGTNINNCQTLNPPTWIQGTWIKQNSPVGSYTGYKFTSDDVIDIGSQSFSNSRKFQLDFYCNSNVNYTVTENTTSVSYFLEINWSGIATYNFAKISDTKIELVNDNDPVNASYYIKE